MKTLHLGIITAIGIAIIGMAVFFIASPVMIIPQTMTSENTENYNMQEILSFCSNPDVEEQGKVCSGHGLTRTFFIF